MRPRKYGYLVLVAASVAALVAARLRVSMEMASVETLALDLLGVSLIVWLANLLGCEVLPRQQGKGFPWRPPGSLGGLLEAHPGRIGMLLLSVIFQSAALDVRSPVSNSPDYYSSLYFWALSVVFFVLACTPVPSTSPSPKKAIEWLMARRFDLAALILLAELAFILRVIWRDTVPYPLSGDEASVGMSGLAIFAGHTTNMFETGWSGQPNLSFLLPGLVQTLFGADVAGLRLFPGIVGALAVPAVYLLALEMWGRRMALIAGLLLASYDFHIHFSRIAVNNVADATIAAAAFYFLWRGLRTSRPLDFGLAGIVAGLGIYSYAGGRVLIALLAIVVAFIALRDRSFAGRHPLGLLAMVGGFTVTSLPIIRFFLGHPNEFMARASQVGIVQSGWLDHELGRGRGLADIAAEQIYRSYFAFIHVPARDGFYNSPEPLLGVMASVFFLIGLGWSIWRWREPAFAMLLLWFFAIVGGTALFVGPPNAERVISTIPAVILLASLGLVLTIRLLGSIAGSSPRTLQMVTVAAVLLISLSSLRFYFLEYTPRFYFADINGEVGMEMGYYLRSLGPGYRGYFFGRPRMSVGFPSIGYLGAGVEMEDMPEELPPDLSFVKHSERLVFVLLPEWSGELASIQARYPEGRLRSFPSRVKPETLFLAWEVPPLSP